MLKIRFNQIANIIIAKLIENDYMFISERLLSFEGKNSTCRLEAANDFCITSNHIYLPVNIEKSKILSCFNCNSEEVAATLIKRYQKLVDDYNNFFVSFSSLTLGDFINGNLIVGTILNKYIDKNLIEPDEKCFLIEGKNSKEIKLAIGKSIGNVRFYPCYFLEVNKNE